MRDANVSPGREARLRLHLRRMRPRIERLRENGRSDPNVLAILAVESFYRPRALRAIEYAVWLVRSLLGRQSAAKITVGVAQARVSHWRDLGMLDSERFSVAGLARVLDLDANYEVCRRYLSERRVLDERDPRTITTAYAGGSRRHFAVMLEQALIAVAH